MTQFNQCFLQIQIYCIAIDYDTRRETGRRLILLFLFGRLVNRKTMLMAKLVQLNPSRAAKKSQQLTNRSSVATYN